MYKQLLAGASLYHANLESDQTHTQNLKLI